ncbi:MAG: serine--tRNA ligase [Candidatus Omnitrophota bacterium]|nr:MAG: serine--tRNA ligase [Candidatus Omnitrophota bacterium]
MLDAKFIRNNPDLVRQAIRNRNYKFDIDTFLKLEQERRTLLAQIEELYAAQNKIDKEVKTLLAEKKDPQSKIEESKRIKQKLADIEKQFSEFDAKYKTDIDRIPNIPHPSVPIGDASHNKIIKESAKLPKFDFKPQEHIVLAEHLNIIDFKRAAKITGSNFVLFKGEGARLERALFNFMVDLHAAEGGYTEIFPPKLVNRASMRATGQLPNLEEDMYVTKEEDLFLIPTAEVPLTNIYRDEILNEDDLPIYYVAYTPCFRLEAGSYGKETRGLMRVHEFDKVELVKFVKPSDSYDELDKLLADACKVLDMLALPYRVAILSTQDMSFAASKCYDIELYAPGLDRWLEVSSCSNFEDFQARRGNIRYKDTKTGKTQYVHTLNGSGVALARLVAAILENYQQKDGSVIIPKVLKRYMDGRKKITK